MSRKRPLLAAIVTAAGAWGSIACGRGAMVRDDGLRDGTVATVDSFMAR